MYPTALQTHTKQCIAELAKDIDQSCCWHMQKALGNLLTRLAFCCYKKTNGIGCLFFAWGNVEVGEMGGLVGRGDKWGLTTHLHQEWQASCTLLDSGHCKAVTAFLSCQLLSPLAHSSSSCFLQQVTLKMTTECSQDFFTIHMRTRLHSFMKKKVHYATDPLLYRSPSPETYKKNFAETFAGRFTNCSLYPNWKCGKDGKGWMCGIAVVKAGMHHFASLAQTLRFFTKFPCNNKQNTPSQDTTWNWSSIFPLVSTGMFLSILFAHKQTSSSSKFHQNLWQHPIFLGCLLNWVAFIDGFPPFFFMFISTSFIFLPVGVLPWSQILQLVH